MELPLTPEEDARIKDASLRMVSAMPDDLPATHALIAMAQALGACIGLHAKNLDHCLKGVDLFSALISVMAVKALAQQAGRELDKDDLKRMVDAVIPTVR